ERTPPLSEPRPRDRHPVLERAAGQHRRCGRVHLGPRGPHRGWTADPVRRRGEPERPPCRLRTGVLSMAARDVLAVVLGEGRRFGDPLAAAAESPQELRRLFAELGWDLDALDVGIDALAA